MSASAAELGPVKRIVLRLANIASLPVHPVSRSERHVWLSLIWHPLTTNLVVFFGLSLIIFRRNAEFLFYGGDGTFEATLIEQFPNFVPPLVGFTSDVLRGLGNVIFTVNPYWIPAYFLPMTWQGDYSNFALTYTICASEMFVGTYATARAMQFPQIVGVAAAWLAPVVIFPYFGFGLIAHTAAAFPHYGTTMVIATLVAVACSIPAGRSAPGYVIAVASILMGVSIIAIIAPTLLILVVPLTVYSMLVTCIDSGRLRESVLPLVIFGVTGAVCLAGYGLFLAGLLLDTTASFFKGLSIRPATLEDISLLFWSPYPFLNPARVFIGGGLIGAILVACAGRGRMRRIAIAVLLTEASIFAIGGIQFIRPIWFGPAPWYFEGFLFCYLAIFLAAGIYIVARFAALLLAAPFKLKRRLFFSRSIVMPAIGVAFAVAATICVLHRGTTGSGSAFYLPPRESESAITKILKSEVSLASERQFRGRVADFLGRSLPDVTDFQIWNHLRYYALQETGNIHGGAGFWQDAIPTLVEYNQLMTPGYFAFTRRFFTRPQDLQTRNRIEMRTIDSRLLALLGVRFVVTDAPYSGNSALRSEIPIHVTDALRKALYSPDVIRDFSLYLYELPLTNLGQYSPTSHVVVTHAADILKVIESPDFDPSLTVVAGEALPGDLKPAKLEEFHFGRGEFHLRATSPGRSVLLLPIEFSNCLRFVNSQGSARFFRADLILAGLMFDDAIDLRFSYFTGPFKNATCRLRDREEFERLDISNAFRDHPEFRP